MRTEYWFSGTIKTTEPVTRDRILRIADRLGFPVEGRGMYKDHVIWTAGHEYSFGVTSCEFTLSVNFYYKLDRDVKQVAMIFEEELGATSGQWLLVGKWCKHLPVSDIICACDCIGLDWFLCDECLKAFPPVYSEGKRTTCYVNGVKCWVSKGRCGEGIEITRSSDRISRYQDEIKNMKKRHALQEEDELGDLHIINERHARQAAQRRKEMESLEEEMGRVFC
jgi:hypothetical protein